MQERSDDIELWNYFESLKSWEGDLFGFVNEELSAFLEKNKVKWNLDKRLLFFFDCRETMKSPVHAVKRLTNHVIEIGDFNPLRSADGHDQDFWLAYDSSSNHMEMYDRVTRTWTILAPLPLHIPSQRYWYKNSANIWTNEELPSGNLVYALWTAQELRRKIRQKINLLALAAETESETRKKLEHKLKQIGSRSCSVQELITDGEGPKIEFKETLDVNLKTNQKHPKAVLSTLKTIAAFLNTEGGTLLIGVSKSGESKGLDRDYNLCGRDKNKDGLEQKLRNLVATRLNPFPLGKLFIRFEQTLGVEVCVVNVESIDKPEYVAIGNEIYVRDGNVTRMLERHDRERWIAKRT